MNASHPGGCPWNEQAVGWALHALEPDEEIALLLHMPECASCQAVVCDAEEVLAGLGASVESIEPPPALRESLLSRAHRTQQLRPLLRARVSPEATAVPGARDAPGPARPTTPAADTPTARTPPAQPKRWSWLTSREGRRLVASTLALVGVLTVGGLAVRTVQLEQERDVETEQATDIADWLTRLDQPGTTHAVLAEPDGSPVAAVLVDEDRRQVVTVGLRPNAADRETYVVWGLGDGAPRAIGTFDSVSADAQLHPVVSTTETEGFFGYVISIEPGRTAPASPSTVVASGRVRA